jgi:hypothetical protein
MAGGVAMAGAGPRAGADGAITIETGTAVTAAGIAVIADVIAANGAVVTGAASVAAVTAIADRVRIVAASMVGPAVAVMA